MRLTAPSTVLPADGPQRSMLVDALKVVCCQLIVLHHFALYGPIGEHAARALPATLDFLLDQARLAVQVFLVIGGFLAASSLSARRRGAKSAIWGRYLRLAPLLAVSLVMVLAATAALPGSTIPEWVTPWPSLFDIAAHLLLLQDIVGVPSLSAGAWYVSIDFQLFALLALLVSLQRNDVRPVWNGAAPWVVAAAALASLWFFNRQPALEAWAPYFLSSYGLGVLAAWAGYSARCQGLFLLVFSLHLADGLLDPRPRLFLALATALALWLAAGLGRRPGHQRRWLAFWSDAAYAVFVSHYAVIVGLTAWWARGTPPDSWPAPVPLLLGWALCLTLGAALHRWVEPLALGLRLGKLLKPARAKP